MADRTIDLNCDLGEEPDAEARDLDLMGLVTSANVACGGHAGDAASMRRMARAAIERGVALGAHPGYPDRESFGRLELELSTEAIADAVAAQIAALRGIAADEGVALRYVKPHGALYNRAARDERVAAAIAEGVSRVDPRLALFGLAGSAALAVWRSRGLRIVAEAFADRRYEADGSLRARRFADALITAPAAAAEQAVRLALGGWVETAGGRLTVDAASLCVHADTPGAVEIARAVRSALTAAGVALRPAVAGA